MAPDRSKVKPSADHKQVLMHNFLDFRHNFLARLIKICACVLQEGRGLGRRATGDRKRSEQV